jgi:hypothetical protein
MRKPTSSEIENLNMKSATLFCNRQQCSTLYRDRTIVPVVVDPILTRRMRDHQKEGEIGVPSLILADSCLGVKFMYECVMGFRKHEGQGCILADEMYGPFCPSENISPIFSQGTRENATGMACTPWAGS